MPATFEGLDVQPVGQPSQATSTSEIQDLEISRRFSQMLMEQLAEGWQTEDCVALRVDTKQRAIRVTGAVRSQSLYDRIHEVINSTNRSQPGTVDSSAIKIEPGLVPGGH